MEIAARIQKDRMEEVVLIKQMYVSVTKAQLKKAQEKLQEHEVLQFFDLSNAIVLSTHYTCRLYSEKDDTKGI